MKKVILEVTDFDLAGIKSIVRVLTPSPEENLEVILVADEIEIRDRRSKRDD